MMVAGTLLEISVSLAVQGLAFTGLTALFLSEVSIAQASVRLAYDIENTIHLEHLIDSAAARSGWGPAVRYSEISLTSANRVSFDADLDYDGTLDMRSKERTVVEIAARTARTVGLNFRIGRQSIGIGTPLPAGATIVQGIAFARKSEHVGLHWVSIPVGEDRVVAVADLAQR